VERHDYGCKNARQRFACNRRGHGPNGVERQNGAVLMRRIASRYALISAYWTVGLYGYCTALLPTFGVSQATQKTHAIVAAVALGIAGLGVCTPTYYRMLMDSDWKARAQRPLLSAAGAVLFCFTMILLSAYFFGTDALGARNGSRLHALTGLFGYFAGRWIYKK